MVALQPSETFTFRACVRGSKKRCFFSQGVVSELVTRQLHGRAQGPGCNRGTVKTQLHGELRTCGVSSSSRWQGTETEQQLAGNRNRTVSGREGPLVPPSGPRENLGHARHGWNDIYL